MNTEHRNTLILWLINDCKNNSTIDTNNKILDLECHKQCSLGQYSGPMWNISIKNLVSDNPYYPDSLIILNTFLYLNYNFYQFYPFKI